jgi:hypothetical protein
MADLIALIVIFLLVWIITVQLLRWSFEHDDDVTLLNTYKFRVKIIEYTRKRNNGILIARYGGTEYVFIDKGCKFKDILEYNIGNFLFISFISKVKGILLIEQVMYLTDVSDHQYKHFDKWL